MEERGSSTSLDRQWIERVAKKLEQSRDRTQQAFGAYRDKVQIVEDELAQRFAAVEAHEAQLTGVQKGILEKGRRIARKLRQQQVRHRKDLETQRAELVAQVACGDEVEQLRIKAEELEKILASQREELANERTRSQELTQQLAKQRQETESLTDRGDSLKHEQATLAESLSKVEKELKHVQAQREHEAAQLEELRSKLDAAQCEAQKHVGQIAELEERLAQQEKSHDSQSQDVSSLRAQKEALAESLQNAESALKQSHANCAQHAVQVIELSDKLEIALSTAIELKARNAQLDEGLAQQQTNSNAQSEEIVALRAERDNRAQQLTEAERRFEEQSTSGDDRQEVGDLQRRLEMMIDEVRELKEQNVQLEAKLAKNKGTPRQPAVADTGAMDWEAQKRRLLASLDEQFDDNSPVDQEERFKIEGAIQQTDEVVAACDRELAEKNHQVEELKQQLAEQARRTDEAAAARELLGQDAVIRQETERLQALQQQWDEKLRQAEVDLSLERAKVARERAKLDEELQTLRNEKTVAGRPGEADNRSAKPSRGRWLARLGLQDVDNP